MLISIGRTEQRKCDRLLSIGVPIGGRQLADSEHFEVLACLRTGYHAYVYTHRHTQGACESRMQSVGFGDMATNHRPPTET